MSKSKFMTAAEEMKDRLGPALCLAKWQQVSLHLPTGLNNSCYHPPLHEMDSQVVEFKPSAIHNTQYKKEQRKKMLNGERPKECNYCWTMEDAGHLSDRHYRSGEPWAAEHYNNIVDQPWDADVTPSYVEVNFSHGCNLACSYCSPQFSTEWGKDIDRWGAYPTKSPHNDPMHFKGRRQPIPVRENNPYVEAFWKWWPDLYGSLKHFRMTGGEPLMDKNTHRVFDYILAAPKNDLHVDVTSNFSVPEELFVKYLTKVKDLCTGTKIEHFMQYVSLDTGIAEHAEYIRDGLDYNQWMQNAQELLSHNSIKAMHFMCTINALCLTTLPNFLSQLMGLKQTYGRERVSFTLNILRFPSFQSALVLPDNLRTQFKNNLQAWLDTHRLHPLMHEHEINHLQRLIDYLDVVKTPHSETFSMPKLLNDFKQFHTQYDQRRGKDFAATFPILQEWYQQL